MKLFSRAECEALQGELYDPMFTTIQYVFIKGANRYPVLKGVTNYRRARTMFLQSMYRGMLAKQLFSNFYNHAFDYVLMLDSGESVDADISHYLECSDTLTKGYKEYALSYRCKYTDIYFTTTIIERTLVEAIQSLQNQMVNAVDIDVDRYQFKVA